MCSINSRHCSGIPERNWLTVRPHDTLIYGRRAHRAKLRAETMDTSAVRGPHSPSVSLPHTLAGLNYAITAWRLYAEYQWFQARAITTFGWSSDAALWLTLNIFFLDGGVSGRHDQVNRSWRHPDCVACGGVEGSGGRRERNFGLQNQSFSTWNRPFYVTDELGVQLCVQFSKTKYDTKCGSL